MAHAKKEAKKVRGVFERPPGSGVWWINYYVDGKQRREKVGTRSAAIDLYMKRKTDAREGRKLPVLRNTRTVTLGELIEDALEFVRDHKSKRDYDTKAEIVKNALGKRPAAEITPQEIERWLRSHCKTAATNNRYKAFISLCYREGLSNGKVSVNPARLLRIRKEGSGRYRFLSRDEYDDLHQAVTSLFPGHIAEFVVSVHTGMRLSEQYSITWGQVDLTRKTIDLTTTKNGSARTVHLNADALEALRSVRHQAAKPSDVVFPRQGNGRDTRSWFHPAMAEAKITGYVWHCNRHTFCSWLAMAGATIKEIQEAAGHKSIAMSARYSHLTPEHRLSVVERIASVGRDAASD